jgi:5-methylcytosine-specific restriction endonuclease McrA
MALFDYDVLREMSYSEYLKTYHWRTMRRLALEASEQRCILCDSPDDLDVHHRTYDRKAAERMTDVVVLCRSCHERVHDIAVIPPPDPNDLGSILSGRGRGKRTR